MLSAVFDKGKGPFRLAAIYECESSLEKEVGIAERESKWPCHTINELSFQSILRVIY